MNLLVPWGLLSYTFEPVRMMEHAKLKLSRHRELKDKYRLCKYIYINICIFIKINIEYALNI